METDCLLRRLQIYFYEFLINSHGITGLLLKAKKIAASPSTTLSQKASKLMYRQESGLFDFRRTKIPPLLLVIDRSDDLVTPLLNKWTYQAMVHKLIGIKDNKVDLGNAGKFLKDQQLCFHLSISQL
uniref:Uncharacterized protein n=1 Tax=Lactuca sativa TaxID=4236 RepID=A0A9R1VGR6_LACSA|nr:hypothetical protein LSAT_V11C500297670 [Lactuca sativa]